MAGCGCEIDENDAVESRTLWILLIINGVMFFAEAITGWLAESTALLADSLDMLADATVYAVALYAVGKAASLKARSAKMSGIMQCSLGALVLFEVIRRFLYGSDPVSTLMMGVGAIALVANVTCLLLLNKHRHGEVHMRASWIFSANDVIANLGVILSGALVLWLNARWPDLLIGAIIAAVVFRGGLQILKEARQARQNAKTADKKCGPDSSERNFPA